MWIRWSPGMPQTYLESLMNFRSETDETLKVI
jgi:hypothetical protein